MLCTLAVRSPAATESLRSVVEIRSHELFPAPKNQEVLRAFDELSDVVEGALRQSAGGLPAEFPTDIVAFTTELQDPAVRAGVIGILPEGERIASDVRAAIARYRESSGTMAAFGPLMDRLRDAREQARRSVEIRAGWLAETIKAEGASLDADPAIETLREHAKMLDALSWFFNPSPRLRDQARNFRLELRRIERRRAEEAVAALEPASANAAPPGVDERSADRAETPAAERLKPAAAVDPIKELEQAERAAVLVGFFRQWKQGFSGALEELEQRVPPDQVMPAYAVAVRRTTGIMLQNLEVAAAADAQDPLPAAGMRMLAMLSDMEETAARVSSSRTQFKERVAGTRDAVRRLMLHAKSPEQLEQDLRSLSSRMTGEWNGVGRHELAPSGSIRSPEVADAWKFVEEWRSAYLEHAKDGAAMTPDQALDRFVKTVRAITKEDLDYLYSVEAGDPDFPVLQAAARLIDLMSGLYLAAIETSTTIGEFFGKIRAPVEAIELQLSAAKSLDEFEARAAAAVRKFIADHPARSPVKAAAPGSGFDESRREVPSDEGRPGDFEDGDDSIAIVAGAVEHWQELREELMSERDAFVLDRASRERGVRLVQAVPDLRIPVLLTAHNYAEAGRDALKRYRIDFQDVASSDPEAFETSQFVIEQLIRLQDALARPEEMEALEIEFAEAMAGAIDLEDLRSIAKDFVDARVRGRTN